MRLSVFLRFSIAEKVRVGTLSEVGRDIAFEYGSNFLSKGLNIAPFRLPAKAGVQLSDRFTTSLTARGRTAGRRCQSPAKGRIQRKGIMIVLRLKSG